MRYYLSLIFWGLLLTIVDVWINGFELLVDGIGYLLIAAGCRGLVSFSRSFLVAQRMCFVLVAFWLLGFLIEKDFSLPLDLAVLVADCMMMWHLLEAVSEYALKKYRPDLAQSAQSRRVAYCAIMIAIWLMGLAARTPADSGFWIAMLSFANFVVLMMILSLIYRVRSIAK